MSRDSAKWKRIEREIDRQQRAMPIFLVYDDGPPFRFESIEYGSPAWPSRSEWVPPGCERAA